MDNFVFFLIFILISICLIGAIMTLVLWFITIGMYFYGVITGKKNKSTKWFNRDI